MGSKGDAGGFRVDAYGFYFRVLDISTSGLVSWNFFCEPFSLNFENWRESQNLRISPNFQLQKNSDRSYISVPVHTS